ncbi:hypothetical protein V8J82_23020 [Gymnodinialimonas sp. 2305UL16-5]|uniref:hypothetical protein n=1 Tax=Gymnodinialimonas mytili TaxID=3126503 RepID=UPI0030A91F07
MPVIRISLARFQPSNADTVHALLDESRAILVPAIQGLKGNLGFYAGVDAAQGAMTNVSLWETEQDALQMANLRAMTDLAKAFVDAVVQFERPITNHQVLWSI